LEETQRRYLISSTSVTSKGAEEKTSGDFGNAVYLSLNNRCVAKGDLMIHDINESLDQLNKSTER